MDAEKNALRSADKTKGSFVPVNHLPKAEPKKTAQKNSNLPMAARYGGGFPLWFLVKQI